MCLAGVDAIKISSPFAGAGFISPKFYREFVLPYESEIARAVKQRNVHIYTHTCGAVSDRLEMMFDAGVSGIECLDPPPLGNVELEDAKRRTRARGFIKGNVDSVNTLLLGSREDILTDARERIEIGKDGGGFIFSTACSVAPRVQREKLLLLREAVDEWG
jgi:uroporphyrinogen decarboxylase